MPGFRRHLQPGSRCGNALAARADCGMLWSWDTAHLSVARDRPGPFEIDVPGPPTHVQKGRGSWCFLQVPLLQERPEWPVFPVPRRGSSGSRGANSPRMEIVSVMRRKIAVGMLGLALAGCAQSRSSLPVAASRGQPIGMEPVPSINDTINRGTGDPAIVQATLPDPKNPNWSGEFIPPRGPAGTPPGPQVARSDAVQGSASSTDSAGRASAPASAVLASPSSPPPASAAGLLAGAGMPAPAVDPQAARAPTAPPVQTVPAQQPVMADLEVSRSPGEVPPTAAAAGSPSPDQALPPVEEPRAVGGAGAPLEDAVAPTVGGSNRDGSGRGGSDRCAESVVRPDACPCSSCPGSPWSGFDGGSASGARSRPDAGHRFTSACLCQRQDHTTTRG